MAIKNSVSNDFLSTFIDSINIFHCCLSNVITCIHSHSCKFNLHHKFVYGLSKGDCMDAQARLSLGLEG